MNTDKLLDIINCTLTDKNIYELFKNHGYDESFGNLQKDLANLLDKFIVTDGELNEVAGGRASVLTRVSSGILASIASFSGMNFVGAQTLTEEQSKSQKILNNIKETGVNSAKKAAKFVINNGGKIAGGGTLLVTWSLLCALIGRYTKEVPVVETKDMTEDEKKLIEFAQEVLKKISEDIKSGSKKYFNSENDNYESLQELITGSEKIGGIQKISGGVNVGQLVERLLPERKENSTQAYRNGRDKLIKYEQELIALAKKLITKHSDDNVETLEQEIEKLKKESEEQQKKLETVGREKKELQEQIKTAGTPQEGKIADLEKDKQSLTNQLNQVSDEKKKVDEELEDLKKKHKETEESLEKKDLELNTKNNEIQQLTEKNQQLQKDIEAVKQASDLKDQQIEHAGKQETELLAQNNELRRQLAVGKENVSLTNWNGVGEGYLDELGKKEKTEKLAAWIKSNNVSVTQEILTKLTAIFFGGKEDFTAPSTLPTPYQTGIFGNFKYSFWARTSYFEPLTRKQLIKQFIDEDLWIKLFEALEKSNNPADVDLVFVVFQVCRLAGWTFVPKVICEALLEHYKNCEKNKTNCNAKLKERIEKLLKSCGLELKDNGIYLKGAGNQQPPVFPR